MDRDFKGIWIPKEIWLDDNLTVQEKLFYVEIDSLDGPDGCYAGNQYFADFFGISTTRVSLVIKSLIDKQYIKSEIIYKEGTKQILKRVLNISYRPYLTNIKDPYLTKVKDPIKQKLKENNTVNNTFINNTINKGVTFQPMVETLFLDVVKYFPDRCKPSTVKAKNQWKEELRKLIEIDKVDANTIEHVVKIIREDDFWKSNFLSILKLRKKDNQGVKYIDKFIEVAKKNLQEDKFYNSYQAGLGAIELMRQERMKKENNNSNELPL